MKKVMAGIDLHSNNLVVGIVDQDGKRVGQQKLPCELEAVEKFLAPFKKRLESRQPVERYTSRLRSEAPGHFEYETVARGFPEVCIEVHWTAIRGQAKPFVGFGQILREEAAISIHLAELQLGADVASARCL